MSDPSAPSRHDIDQLELRTVRDEEFPAFAEAVSRAFGESISETELAAERLVFEPERFYAAFSPTADIVGTCGAFTFELALPGGSSAACAGVTVVGVRQDHRRRGLLSRMMLRLLDDARERGEPFAALWASEASIYGRYGFGPGIPMVQLEIPRAQLRLRQPVSADQVQLISVEAAVEQLPELYDLARTQRPGMLSRSENWWRRLIEHDAPDSRDGAGPRTVGVLPGRGYVVYRLKPGWSANTPQGTVRVSELVSLDPEATAALWTFVAMTDLASTIKAYARPLDDPLPDMVADSAQVQVSSFSPVYLRVLDVVAALELRGYQATGSINVEVVDPTYGELSGTFHLEVVDGVGRCERTDAAPDLRMGTEELSTLILGGVQPRVLLEARRIVEVSAGAARRLGHLLASDHAPVQGSEF